jgi:peptidoglycan-N-acetylglucosamine deacetylase
LTFDDGPGPFTARIAAILERAHVPATFFEIGRQVQAYPAITRRLLARGFVVADHTENHPPLARLAPAQQRAEILAAAQHIRAAGGPWPLLFRPPYGSFDIATMQSLRALHMLMVLWSVDTKDYSRPGVSRIVYTAVSGAEPGAIVLMHDGGGDRSETVAALPRIITRLRQRGFRLVTISQLVADDPPPKNQPPPHSLAGF